MLAITGSSGFIGSYIADFLPFPQKRLVRHLALTNSNHSPETCLTGSTDITWIEGDLQSKETVTPFVDNASILIHLASSSNPRTPFLHIKEDIDQHLEPTSSLFERYAKANPGGHVIFASSGGNMYSDQQPWQPRTEEDLPLPRSFYSINKLTAENHLRLCCEKYQIGATVLRISNPYGVILPSARGHGFIGIALSCALNDKPIAIIEPWDTMRDYLHLDDLAKAFKIVIEQPPKKGEFRLFNVSSGIGHSLKEVLEIIEVVTEKEIKKTNLFDPLQGQSWSVLSYEKMRKTLGWQPTTTLQKGIEKMWENYAKNAFLVKSVL